MPRQQPGSAAWSVPRRRPARLSRRTLLAKALLTGATVPAASLLAACGTQLYTSGSVPIASPQHPVRWPIHHDNQPIEAGLSAQPGSTLQLYNYADYISAKVVKGFERAYGVNVSVSTFNDTDEALSKIASGNVPYDLYFPSYDQIGKMVAAKLLRPLNHTYIPAISNVWPQFENPWYDLGWQYSVSYTVYSTGIGWRTDQVHEDIGQRANPYDVFWDPEYAGRLAVIDDWHTAMGMVLLRNGITDINTAKEADLSLLRAQLMDMLSKTHPKVTVTMYNDLPAGQLALAQMWSGDVVNAVYYLPKHQSPDVLRYWFPSDGAGMVDNDLMTVLAGGRNPVAAHLFIDWMLKPANAAANFSYIGYQPPQRSINPTQLVQQKFVPPNLATAAVLPRYFRRGVRMLELPPTVDGQYHEIWQEFKAGG